MRNQDTVETALHSVRERNLLRRYTEEHLEKDLAKITGRLQKSEGRFATAIPATGRVSENEEERRFRFFMPTEPSWEGDEFVFRLAAPLQPFLDSGQPVEVLLSGITQDGTDTVTVAIPATVYNGSVVLRLSRSSMEKCPIVLELAEVAAVKVNPLPQEEKKRSLQKLLQRLFQPRTSLQGAAAHAETADTPVPIGFWRGVNNMPDVSYGVQLGEDGSVFMTLASENPDRAEALVRFDLRVEGEEEPVLGGIARLKPHPALPRWLCTFNLGKGFRFPGEPEGLTMSCNVVTPDQLGDKDREALAWSASHAAQVSIRHALKAIESQLRER